MKAKNIRIEYEFESKIELQLALRKKKTVVFKYHDPNLDHVFSMFLHYDLINKSVYFYNFIGGKEEKYTIEIKDHDLSEFLLIEEGPVNFY